MPNLTVVFIYQQIMPQKGKPGVDSFDRYESGPINELKGEGEIRVDKNLSYILYSNSELYTELTRVTYAIARVSI